MRVSTVFALLLGATSAVALAQDTRNSTRSSDPQHGGVRADAQSTQNTTSATTTESSSIVSGTVVRYEPGRTIVVRDANNQERTFNLGPGVTLPVDIHVGAQVELATESNGVNVTRVSSGSGAAGTSGMSGSTGTTGSGTLPNAGTTTTPGSTDSGASTSSTPPSGTSGTTTGTTMSGSTDAGSSYSSTTTSSTTRRSGQLPKTGSSTATSASWVSGTVTAYTPGQSVTISMPGGTTVEYRVDSSSTLPSDLAIGRTVKIHSDAGTEGSQPLARQITYTKTTTTHHKKVSSQR